MSDHKLATIPAEESDESAVGKTAAQKDYDKGVEHLKAKENTLAANAFHNALVGFEQEQNENGLANTADKLGDLCAERGEHEAALRHYARAFQICTTANDRFSLMALNKKKAAVSFAAHNYPEAIELYLDLLDEYGALRNPEGSVQILEALAEVFLANGEKEKASDAYRTASGIHANFQHQNHAKELLAKAEAIK